ncbi:MAG TPA: TetR family transcriptional regulator [Steroidobacteraceae bacterium]|nr:TetR family transcriptional regulator [Steroidobacteraceae bacterium]
MKTSQHEIVAVALALVDEEGLDSLNMRALAARLGLQASTLYWYIGSKEELLNSMASTFSRRAMAATPDDVSWREWLMAFGRAFLAELLAHRDSARICATARPMDSDTLEMNDRLVKPLICAGLDAHTANCYLGSVVALSLGCAFAEQSSSFHAPYMMEIHEVHGTGLSSMIAGFPEPAALENASSGRTTSA